jgi:transcriptional pleiotropic regulator of transition state genes
VDVPAQPDSVSRPVSTGMSRKVDDLGRIVLPAEMRRMFGIRSGDELEISVDSGAIMLRKVEARCVFCDSLDGLREFRGKRLCESCARDLVASDTASGTFESPSY